MTNVIKCCSQCWHELVMLGNVGTTKMRQQFQVILTLLGKGEPLTTLSMDDATIVTDYTTNIGRDHKFACGRVQKNHILFGIEKLYK